MSWRHSTAELIEQLRIRIEFYQKILKLIFFFQLLFSTSFFALNILEYIVVLLLIYVY